MSQSIEALLKDLGIAYDLQGEEAYSSCPFHSPDHHPSWSVNVRSGLHFCFSCGARGSLSHLVSHLRGISYETATLYVNERVGWAKADQWREDYENKNYSPPYFKVTEADMALFTSPPGEALASRGITAEAAWVFHVYWNPKNESWICPYYDPYTDELWGWQEKNQRMFRNYPAGSSRGRTLSGYNQFPAGEPAILVESPLDCCKLYDAGFPNGLSSFGAGVSEQQLKLIQLKTETLIVAMDNDKAGLSAARDIVFEAEKMFKSTKVINYAYTKAKDPGDMTVEEIQIAIRTSIPAIKWLKGEMHWCF